jgi:hypothetical protein
MNLWQRFKKLTFWNKIGAFGAICSILAVMWLLFSNAETSVNISVQDSPDTKVQTAVNSPNTTQIIAENVTINLPPQLERKLTIDAVYVNKPQDKKYVTLLRGKLKTPYPIPNLRIEAYGETVEEIQFTGTGLYVLSDRGKSEGYVFATWQDARGNLELNIVSSQPGKLRIHFVEGN